MNEPGDRQESGWDAGWDGHSLAQARRLARLPLTEKLRWLEEAQRTAEAIRRDPKRRAEREGGSR